MKKKATIILKILAYLQIVLNNRLKIVKTVF